jgi:hypothetical protein
VNGEILATFTPIPLLSLYAGPTIGFFVSGVEPGRNHWFEDCNSGAPCAKMPGETKSAYAGFVAGVGLNID